jgi:hypothetical protein
MVAEPRVWGKESQNGMANCCNRRAGVRLRQEIGGADMTALALELLAITRRIDAFLNGEVSISDRPLDAYREFDAELVAAVAKINAAMATA